MNATKGLNVLALLGVLAFGCSDDDDKSHPNDNGAQKSSTDNNGEAESPTSEPKQAKYVFLFIGDGLGMPQINSAEIYKAHLEGKAEGAINIKTLRMTQLAHQGFATTFSSNSYITDSAAAGTALACGKKTNGGVISMDPGGTNSFPTLAEKARDAGMKIGIVSSVSLDHATPAVFYSHTPSRNNYYEIGKALVASSFDYFGGGGLRSDKYPEGTPENEIIDAAKAAGYTYVEDRADFDALEAGAGKVLAINAVRDSANALPYAIDRDKEDGSDDLALVEYTRKGIELLKDDPEGFFMMVEGGKIDWACHANDATSAIWDTLAFDEAVGAALEFAEQHPDETLVVVTGDHECGGMTIGFAGTGYQTFFDKLGGQEISVSAFDKIVMEVQPTTLEDISDEIEAVFKLDTNDDGQGLKLSAYEITLLENAFEAMLLLQSDNLPIEDTVERHTYDLAYGGYNPLTVTITYILNRKAGIGWTSYSHTGVPVPVFAQGPGAEQFNGYYDNTDVHAKLMSSMKLGL